MFIHGETRAHTFPGPRGAGDNLKPTMVLATRLSSEIRSLFYILNVWIVLTVPTSAGEKKDTARGSREAGSTYRIYDGATDRQTALSDCKRFYDQNDLEMALQACNVAASDQSWALRVKHVDPDVYHYRCLANYQLKDYNAALSDCLKLSRVRPSDVLWNKIGLIYQALDRHEEAIKSFTEAVKANKNFAEAFRNRGVSEEHALGPFEPLKDYASALKAAPGDPETLILRAHLYLRSANLDNRNRNCPAAESDANAATATAGAAKLAEALIVRGDARACQGHYDAALDDYKASGRMGILNGVTQELEFRSAVRSTIAAVLVLVGVLALFWCLQARHQGQYRDTAAAVIWILCVIVPLVFLQQDLNLETPPEGFGPIPGDQLSAITMLNNQLIAKNYTSGLWAVLGLLFGWIPGRIIRVLPRMTTAVKMTSV